MFGCSFDSSRNKAPLNLASTRTSSGRGRGCRGSIILASGAPLILPAEIPPEDVVKWTVDEGRRNVRSILVSCQYGGSWAEGGASPEWLVMALAKAVDAAVVRLYLVVVEKGDRIVIAIAPCLAGLV